MAGRRVGFTLIELLVAVAVIMVLAAILFPVYNTVRARNQQTACLSNLRQLGVAAEMYQHDWGEMLVPWGAPFDWSGHLWPELLNPYLRQIEGERMNGAGKLGRVFRCPVAEEDELFQWTAERSYGMNTYCGGWFPNTEPISVPVAKVRYPSLTVRIAETWWPASQSGTLFAPTPNPPLDYLKPPGRHMGRNNVLWMDGHVACMTNERYLLTDDVVDSLGNIGNVWCRFEGPKPAH